MIKKTRCTVSITLNMLLAKLLKNFVILLFLAAAFILIGASLIVFNFKDYDEMELAKLCDIDKTGYIYFNDEFESTREEEYKFYDAVKQSRYVTCIGDNSMSYIEEEDSVVTDIQAGHQEISEGVIETACLDKEMLQIFNLDVDYNESKELPGLILGYEFRGALGNQKTLRCDGTEYPILGFTTGKTKWISDEMGSNSLPDITGLVDTGYMCFYVDEAGERMTDRSWFQLSDAENYTLFKKETEELAKECHVPAVVCSLQDYLKLEEERNEAVFAELIDYAQKAMGVIILFLILIKLYSFWGNKRQYGIMYSSGMTAERITATLWAENIILFFLAMIIAYVFLWNGFGLINQIGYGVLEGVIQGLLWNRVFQQEFFVIFLCCILVSVVPAFVFNRITPISMVKDFYE